MISLHTETNLQFADRSEWSDWIPDHRLVLSEQPVPYVLVLYTETDPCLDSETCVKTLRKLQDQHLHVDNMTDIKWNFMVGGDGKVYIGRGWELNATKDPEYEQYEDRSLDFAYIASHGKNEVTPLMKESMDELIRVGVSEGYIKKDYKLITKN